MGTFGWLLCAALLAVDHPAEPATTPAEAATTPAEPATTPAEPATKAAITEPPPDPEAVAAEPEGGAGVSPVELVPKLELRQAFMQLPANVSLHEATWEMDIQFLRRILLRSEVPIRLLRTPAAQVSGVGDLKFQIIAIVAVAPTFLVVALAGVEASTATQPQLGSGKQQLIFGGAAAVKPVRWWLPYVIAQEELSVAGNTLAPNTNQLLVRVGNIFFGKRFNWLKLDLDTSVDFEQRAGRFFGTLEAGSLLIGRVGLFMRAGTQLVGERQLDYSLSTGLRYLFRLESPKPK